MEKSELRSDVSNYCKNCGEAIPKVLDFCSKSCLDKIKAKNENALRSIQSLKELKYTEIDNPFTKFANSTGVEREKLGKIIDSNAKLAEIYCQEVRIAYEIEPDLPKISFEEWLKSEGWIS